MLPSSTEDESMVSLDDLPLAACAFDASGRPTLCNRRWSALLADDPWPSLFDPGSRVEALADWDAAIARRTAFERHLRLRAKDGALEVFWVGVSPRASGFVALLEPHDRRSPAREALDRLTELTASLSHATALREIGEIIVGQGMRNASADTAVLYVFDAERERLELLAHRGIAAEIVERIRVIDSHGPGRATYDAFVAGDAIWAETPAEYAALFPSLVRAAATGPRAKAFWCAPLGVDGKRVGVLAMGFYEPRTFRPRDRAFVETFATQCGQALDRAVLQEREIAGRRLLATTLESIGDAVIATDIHGRVTFMNRVAEALTSWTATEAVGKALDDVFHIFSEQTRELVESPVTKVLRAGTVVGLANHTVLRARDGTEVPIDDSAAPIRDGEGKLLGVVLVFRDATTEKRNQARRAFLARAGTTLSASLDYRKTLASIAHLVVPQLADWCSIELLEPGDAMPKQLAVAHRDPKKVEWARELGERYPADPTAKTGSAEVIRTGRSILYPSIPRELVEAAAQDEEHLRIIRELELASALIVPLKGRDLTFGAISFVHADSGRHYGEDDVVFAEDFARRAAMAIENARALKEVADARDEAERANKAKDEFLATVSHELRTPLQAILGWTSVLREGHSPKELERGLAVIERNALHQARLIDDLLDLSRVVSGKLPLSLQTTVLSHVVDAAAEAVEAAAKRKDVRVSRHVDPSITLMADGERLQQIVWNLLANAVKFSARGGHVEVSATAAEGEIVLSVTDEGEGIAEHELGRLFERFHQVDGTSSRRHGGLGLGLAIVRQLVDAHGGSVDVRSGGLGQGATFTVRLPNRNIPAVVARASRTTPTTTVDADRSARLGGLSILVVDDEEDAREVVAAVLAREGANVDTAHSAAAALEMLAALAPDVIVSDIGMPELDGYGFMRAVRGRDGARAPALALTAYATADDVRRSLEAGFDAHLPKPAKAGSLIDAIARLAGRR